MLTDGDAVFGSTDAEAAAVLQGDLCPGGDALAVDEGAVAGAFVYEDQELAAILQRAVPAADGGGALRETDLTAGVTADGDLACRYGNNSAIRQLHPEGGRIYASGNGAAGDSAGG